MQDPMSIYKLLDQSNCRECGEATCLAFAAAVFRGQRDLSECTHLSQEVLQAYGGQIPARKTVEEDMDQAMQAVQQKVRTIDLAAAARRTGGHFANGTLTLKVMGKNFHVHADGSLSADIHVNPWISIPVLKYVLEGTGRQPTGKWIPFRELSQGHSWQGLFEQRCEKPLKKIADTYTGLFQDMLEVFSGRQTESLHDSDISIVLYPLPKVPLLICYWKAEEGLESSLHLFFDETVEDNIDINAVFAIGSGLVRMFEQIALKHEGRGKTYF